MPDTHTLSDLAPAQTLSTRIDHQVIASMVQPGSKVLDVGCSDGALLRLLGRERQVRGRGVELSQQGVNACVARGLSVVQGDADNDLRDYPDNSFDYVILSKTIQAVKRPRVVLQELMRIGERAIVSFPNFGHWRARAKLLLSGRMPNTGAMPTPWCDTENLHLCTVRDFAELARELHYDIERAVPISQTHTGAPFSRTLWRANWFAEEAVFLLARR